jgi:hypothetical protein
MSELCEFWVEVPVRTSTASATTECVAVADALGRPFFDTFTAVWLSWSGLLFCLSIIRCVQIWLVMRGRSNADSGVDSVARSLLPVVVASMLCMIVRGVDIDSAAGRIPWFWTSILTTFTVVGGMVMADILSLHVIETAVPSLHFHPLKPLAYRINRVWYGVLPLIMAALRGYFVEHYWVFQSVLALSSACSTLFMATLTVLLHRSLTSVLSLPEDSLVQYKLGIQPALKQQVELEARAHARVLRKLVRVAMIASLLGTIFNLASAFGAASEHMSSSENRDAPTRLNFSLTMMPEVITMTAFSWCVWYLFNRSPFSQHSIIDTLAVRQLRRGSFDGAAELTVSATQYHDIRHTNTHDNTTTDLKLGDLGPDVLEMTMVPTRFRSSTVTSTAAGSNGSSDMQPSTTMTTTAAFGNLHSNDDRKTSDTVLISSMLQSRTDEAADNTQCSDGNGSGVYENCDTDIEIDEMVQESSSYNGSMRHASQQDDSPHMVYGCVHPSTIRLLLPLLQAFRRSVFALDILSDILLARELARLELWLPFGIAIGAVLLPYLLCVALMSQAFVDILWKVYSKLFGAMPPIAVTDFGSRLHILWSTSSWLLGGILVLSVIFCIPALVCVDVIFLTYYFFSSPNTTSILVFVERTRALLESLVESSISAMLQVWLFVTVPELRSSSTILFYSAATTLFSITRQILTLRRNAEVVGVSTVVYTKYLTSAGVWHVGADWLGLPHVASLRTQTATKVEYSNLKDIELLRRVVDEIAHCLPCTEVSLADNVELFSHHTKSSSKIHCAMGIVCNAITSGRWAHVKSLSLANCGLNSRQLRQLIETLEAYRGLEVLSLEANIGVDDTCMVPLLRLVRNNGSCLRFVDLRHCPVSQSALPLAAQAAETNAYLVEMLLDFPLSDDLQLQLRINQLIAAIRGVRSS